MCWHRCWWPESGRCPLAQSGLPGCSCICKQLTVGDSDTRPEIGRYSDCRHTTIPTISVKLVALMIVKQTKKGWCLLTFQRFWCKVPHRGFWDSIGSLRNSSSTFHHLGSYGSPSHTHLCLVIGRMAEREKESIHLTKISG